MWARYDDAQVRLIYRCFGISLSRIYFSIADIANNSISVHLYRSYFQKGAPAQRKKMLFTNYNSLEIIFIVLL